MTKEVKVTVDDMFRTKSPVSVLGQTFWLRVLSEADTQARDEYAMLAMARRRKAVATPGTREYTIYLENLDTQEDEVLRNAILAVEAAALSRQAQNEITPRLIPFPDNATDEEKAETLAARENEITRIQSERTEWLAKQIDARKESIDKLERPALFASTRAKQIEAQGQAALSQAFMDYTLFAGLFKDEACQEGVFISPEAVGHMPRAARNQVTDAYFKELDRITQLDLQYFFSTGDSKDSSSPSTDSTVPPESLEESRPEK